MVGAARRLGNGSAAIFLLIGLAAACREPAPERPHHIRHPSLALYDAPRAWRLPTAEVVLSGRATPGSAPLASLRIAGADVPIAPDGAFSHRLRLTPGPNLIPLRLEAQDGGRAVDAVTVVAPGDPARSLVVDVPLDTTPLRLSSRGVAAMAAALEGSRLHGDEGTIVVRDAALGPAGALVVGFTDGGCARATLTLAGPVRVALDVSGMAALLGRHVGLSAASMEARVTRCPDRPPDVAMRLPSMAVVTDEEPSLPTAQPRLHAVLAESLRDAATGALLRAAQAVRVPHGLDGLVVAVPASAVNELLAALQDAGRLTLEASSDALRGWPAALGPLVAARVTPLLPPMLVPPRSQEDAADVVAGEVELDLRRHDGARILARLHLRTGLRIDRGADGGPPSPQLDTAARRMEAHASVLECPPDTDPGDFAALLRVAAPSLVRRAADATGFEARP